MDSLRRFRRRTSSAGELDGCGLLQCQMSVTGPSDHNLFFAKK